MRETVHICICYIYDGFCLSGRTLTDTHAMDSGPAT